jgi:hypothetical protein
MTKAHKNITIASFLLGICIFALGAVAEDGKGLNPPVSVRIEDFAELDGETLEAARRIAEEGLGKVGIPVSWVNCTPGADTPSPICTQPMGINHITLRIVPRCRESSTRLSHTIRILDEAGTGVVWLFNGGAARTGASVRGLSYEQVLGHLMAREIGRLLLPPRTGSYGGIRRAKLDQQYWENVALDGLHFTRAEAKTMLAGLQMLQARQQAFRLDEPTPDD